MRPARTGRAFLLLGTERNGMAQRKKRYLLALVLLLMAGLALMIGYASRKQGYHVDELYTYELTNYPGGFYVLQEGYLDTWQPGSLFDSALHPDHAFDYSVPWNNQKIDVHPPLYYCAVYTAECLFPWLDLPWSGLIPNFVCLLAGTFALYWAARRMTGRFWVSWVAAAVFLCNVGTQGMAVFTRMYALLMLETVLLVLAHLTLYRRLLAGERPRLVFLGLAAATMAGALTQYFFLVFCFFFCGLFGLWLLCTRRWKTAALYVVAEFGGLGAAYLAFPTMKQHIFSGSRGQQALGSFFDLSALSDWAASVGRVLSLLGAQFGGAVLWALLLLLAAALLWKAGCRPRGMGLFACMLALAGFFYILVIDKAAPFEADRYYVLIYGPLILAATVVLAKLAALYPRWEPLMAIVVLLPVLSAHLTVGNGYLYTQYADREPALEKTASLSAVVLNKAGYDVAPDLFLPEFARREAVYQAHCGDEAESLADAVESKDLSGGFVLYGYIYEADELLDLAESVLDIQSAELLTDVARCPVYYITLKE